MGRETKRASRTALMAVLRAGALPVAFACVAWIRPAPVAAHEIITTRLTWTEQISRIFQHRCVACHREGGSAPMPLTTYEQVRPWAKAIKYEILSRRMPPWDAVKGYGTFRNDLSLSQDDIAKISSWVEGGAPEGSAVFLPQEPTGDPADSANRQAEGEASTKPTEPVANSLPLSGTQTLEEAVMAVGIAPENVAEGGSMQATAYRPDGSVEPLLWLRGYRPKWRRSHWFREPLDLPRGTRILLFPRGASATLLIAK